eukprot:1716161-Heterocapsa_arctica.AAC.1
MGRHRQGSGHEGRDVPLETRGKGYQHVQGRQHVRSHATWGLNEAAHIVGHAGEQPEGNHEDRAHR